MKRAAILGLLLMVAVTLAHSRAQPPRGDGEADRVGKFMQMKLRHSQRVLEGLTLEDYELMAEHSQRIGLMSLDSTWQVLQSPEYSERSAEFRRVVGRLNQAARAENLDGATLAYVEMTLNCVHCHNFLRSQR